MVDVGSRRDEEGDDLVVALGRGDCECRLFESVCLVYSGVVVEKQLDNAPFAGVGGEMKGGPDLDAGLNKETVRGSVNVVVSLVGAQPLEIKGQLAVHIGAFIHHCGACGGNITR